MVSNFQEIYDLFNKHKISEEINNVNELANKISTDLSQSNEITNEKITIINNLEKNIR